MLKSISTWAFAPSRPAAQVFALARQHGFDGVEVSIGDADFPLSYQVTFDSTPKECAAVVEAAKKAGITLASMASGYGWEFQITGEDSAVRAEAVEITKKALRVASHLGVDAMLLVPGGVGADFIPGFVVTDYEAACNNALDSLKQIAPFADEVRVTLGVENVWNKWLLSPLEFRAFWMQSTHLASVATSMSATSYRRAIPNSGSEYLGLVSLAFTSRISKNRSVLWPVLPPSRR